MSDGIIDVYAAIVREDEAVLALFDPRYDSIAIVRPIVFQDTNGKFIGVKLRLESPVDIEKLYWHEKFGIITDEAFNAEVLRLESKLEKERAYELLSRDLDKPDTLQLRSIVEGETRRANRAEETYNAFLATTNEEGAKRKQELIAAKKDVEDRKKDLSSRIQENQRLLTETQQLKRRITELEATE